ncbi:MAG: PDZ domain-containing protein [Gemmatimonadota bacterium]
MTSSLKIRRNSVFLTVGLAVTLAGVLNAQQAVAGEECSSGWSTLGSIGIEEFACDCTFNQNPGSTFWRFRSEPTVKKLTSGGPAEGKLRPGDVLVAIDGLLITTRSGGVRIANLEAGESVTITVRRGGREIPVEITPGELCDRAQMALPSSPSAPAVAAAPLPRSSTPRVPAVASRAPLARPAPEALPAPLPSAWFGFGINCQNCSVSSVNREQMERSEGELRRHLSQKSENSAEVHELRANLDELRRSSRSWEFSEYPAIYSVDPGSPADLAGIRRGDVLTEIDGISLLSREGGLRFGSVEPGETVQWTYRRGGTAHKAPVKAVERPDAAESASLRARYEDLVASVERLHAQDSSTFTPELARLRERLREDQRTQELALAELAPANQEQHLRFAGMVGTTNVEVRGLGSVDVSFDNATGELLIHTMDATIRVKAPLTR